LYLVQCKIVYPEKYLKFIVILWNFLTLKIKCSKQCKRKSHSASDSCLTHTHVNTYRLILNLLVWLVLKLGVKWIIYSVHCTWIRKRVFDSSVNYIIRKINLQLVAQLYIVKSILMIWWVRKNTSEHVLYAINKIQ